MGQDTRRAERYQALVRPRISIVVAAAENGVIGRDGGLPWHLPADLGHFKAVTMGKPIIMGRKTFESIGRPLPGRSNIVLTTRSGFAADGCIIVSSLDEALCAAAEDGADDVMVIGGASVYAEALPRAERLFLTRVHGLVDGDTRFPVMADEEWEVVGAERHEADERHALAYTFLELRRVC